MRRRVLVCFLLLFAVLTWGVSLAQSGGEPIHQLSTLDALKKGVYDGETTFEEIKKHGDFGLGTLNGLDGEMVGVDGQFFQVRTAGKAYLIPDSDKTPFAVVTFFKAEQERTIGQARSFKELQEVLDRGLPCKDKMYAFRIDALFKKMKVRSVPRQIRPYPGLADAVKNQTVFDLTDVQGSLIGFRFPDYVGGVNVPGYHFHFITADKKAGGHVLDCEAGAATVRVMPVDRLSLNLLNDCEQTTAGKASQ
jgi:acetolactate decarboxylase